MAQSIILSLPDDIAKSVRDIASQSNQSIEDVVLASLKNLANSTPPLPADVQDELSALTHLSDDTLWTIVREQMPDNDQSRAHKLMTKNNQEPLSTDEQNELDKLVERADRLMLRKAEASNILRQRGHNITQQDFKPQNE